MMSTSHSVEDSITYSHVSLIVHSWWLELSRMFLNIFINYEFQI